MQSSTVAIALLGLTLDPAQLEDDNVRGVVNIYAGSLPRMGDQWEWRASGQERNGYINNVTDREGFGRRVDRR